MNNTKTLTFQVGYEASTTISITLADLQVANLGLTDLKISETNTGDEDGQANAQAALATIENAINTVSSQRAKFGAVQNRLEHTINNLGVNAENLSASESRIRNADMAKEMTEFTRNQILVQAGTAMLAQANAVPQNVLRLLG